MKTLLAMVGLAVAAFGITFARSTLWDAPPATPEGMVRIPDGELTMRTDSKPGWDDEKPAHRVKVEGFWMDETERTNVPFARFVNETEYVTTAETRPGTKPPPKERLVPGSLSSVRHRGR